MRLQTRNALSASATGLILGAMFLLIPSSPSAGSGTPVSSRVAPCAEEDSPGPCYWDAGARGNGVGLSFTVDASQVVHYVTDEQGGR